MKQKKLKKLHPFFLPKKDEQKRTQRKKTDPESGATFMEVLVTIAIIAILMTTIGLAVAPFIGNAQESAAKQDINAIKVALTAYFTSNYEYPDESDWKEAIRPFLTEDIKLDPWGNEYKYMKPGPDDIEFGVYSAGKDKIPENEDDITSWKK
jgi:general secretion pathway protein G